MNTLLFAILLMTSATMLLAADVTVAPDSGATQLGIESKTGRISAVKHMRAAHNLVGSTAPGPLYVIELAEPAGRVTADQASSVRVTNEPGDVTLIEAQHEKPVPLTVRCRIRPEPDSQFLLARIAIESTTPIRLASVTFPVISLTLPMRDNAADDRVVMPECDGCVFVDPYTSGVSRDLTYPGGASMQFMAACDSEIGFYMAARDGEGHSKTLSARSREKTLDLSIAHKLPQLPVQQWSLPYDVALTTFDVSGGEGWQQAADLYCAWAVQQPWCERTLKQRADSGDIPAWLLEPSLFYAFSLKGRLPSGGSGGRISLVPAHADAWREALGGPVTFMLMDWEKNGPWVAPDYFPPIGDSDEFSAATKALRDSGHRSLVFLSGLNWTLAKTQRGTYPAIDDQAEFDRRGRPHAITEPTGQPVIYGKPDQDVGQHARICPTTPLADELISASAARCQQYGIDCVQADQLVGGHSPPCFSPSHAHNPGGGNWSANALYQVFARAREQGKARSRDFAFAIEEPGEFFIPVLDTYHARDYQQNRWPRWGKNVIGVPLFTHVYHDYLHGYGGDSAGVSTDQNDSALYHQAMNLVCGKAPAVCVWSRWLEPAEVHPDQLRMLRNHFDLWRGDAKEFLIFGRRVSSLEIPCPPMDITFTDWPAGTHRVITVPSVLQSTWELPDGKRGTVVACISRTPVTITDDGKPLTLSPGDAKLLPAR